MPHLIVIAGPNGAGKSTAAEAILSGLLHLDDFLNADTIARGLSQFNPEKVAFEAGRIMLRRLDDLASSGVDFAFETTLASRTFAPWIARRRAEGYEFHLHFLWVPSPDVSIRRVGGRVSLGGHHVPSEVIARRYVGGPRNLLELYIPIADAWHVYDNTSGTRRVVAEGGQSVSTKVYDDDDVWSAIEEVTRGAKR